MRTRPSIGYAPSPNPRNRRTVARIAFFPAHRRRDGLYLALWPPITTISMIDSRRSSPPRIPRVPLPLDRIRRAIPAPTTKPSPRRRDDACRDGRNFCCDCSPGSSPERCLHILACTSPAGSRRRVHARARPGSVATATEHSQSEHFTLLACIGRSFPLGRGAGRGGLAGFPQVEQRGVSHPVPAMSGG